MLVLVVTGLHFMTLKKTNNILDKSLKELSIQVSLSGLSFCIRDTGREQIVALEEQVFEQPANAESLVNDLELLLDHDAIAGNDFKEVKIVHDNELSTLVPRALFNESNLSDYLKYSVKMLETDYISFDELRSHDMFNVYIPFTNINNYIFDKFGSFEYKHSSTVLVETLLNQYQPGDFNTIYVHVGNASFEVVVMNNSKLVLYNRFPFQTPEDFIYYLLFIFEQLNLNREVDRLYLLGNISKDDRIYEWAYTYIRNIALGDNCNPLKLSREVAFVKKQEHLVLLNSF